MKGSEKKEVSMDDISLENASYLQSLEESNQNNNTEVVNQEVNTPNFEVESIELATPQLFTEEEIISYYYRPGGPYFEMMFDKYGHLFAKGTRKITKH